MIAGLAGTREPEDAAAVCAQTNLPGPAARSTNGGVVAAGFSRFPPQHFKALKLPRF